MKTKLHITVGPSTPEDVLAQLILDGAEYVRINFSHGTTDDHTRYFDVIRRAEALCGKRVRVLGDIQGPKLRIGEVGAFILRQGEPFALDLNPAPGTPARVFLPHTELFEALTPGDTVLLSDGDVELRVLEKTPQSAECICVRGGEVASHRGISVPAKALRMSVLTPFDRQCIENGIAHGMDACMLSFVQSAAHVREIADFIDKRCQIMAKIENATAVADIDAIAYLSDAVVVARGDLAVETRLARVPLLQKRVLDACMRAGKQAILVTQVLESFAQFGRPSLAESNDIYCSVRDGFAGVMLTGETAASKDPRGALAALREAVERAERAGRSEID